MPRTAGIVLAGGRSVRMGTSKAGLDWHGSTLLKRITGLVGRAVDGPVIVVGADCQELPALGPEVELVFDARPDRGPLQGLHAGLAAVRERADVVYASSTDVPLLHPSFIRRVLGAAGDGVDVVLPVVGGHRQTLAAAYRTELRVTVAELLEREILRPAALFERCRVLELTEAELRDDGDIEDDPELDSLRNLNEPAELARALAVPAPEVRVQIGDRRRTVRAWTVFAAAAAAGVGFDEARVAIASGPAVPGAVVPVTVTRDPDFPLVPGDVVCLTTSPG
jgi:molybdopterin-guanine dinucleotide biosynthesis protein A